MIEITNTRNPILPLAIHIPDSEGHVMSDGKLYLYGSYDDRETEYCSEKYYVVSTPDMEHWMIHGPSMDGKDVPWFNNPDAPKYSGDIDWMHPTPFLQKMIQRMIDQALSEGKNLEDLVANAANADTACKPPMLFAPDCIEKDGKYYLYFCMTDGSEGVAVSDKPEGPFLNPIQLPCGGIDPAIFIDEDGQAYYYWGQIHSRGVKLHPDMISFHPEEAVDNLLTEEKHFFHEGSSMRKIGDTYYYVFADVERGKPTSLGYATGKSPLGPFTYRGIIVDNAECDPASWNNHGSIECVNGQWYVFYHRCSRGGEYHRRLCIEPITINPDGTIDEVKMTSQGVGAPFAQGEPIMGYQACGLKGSIYIGVNERKAVHLDGAVPYEEKLTHITDGDEAVFRYVKSSRAYTGINIKAIGSGKIQILMNGINAGMVEIENGQQKNNAIFADAGEYELTLRFETAKNLEVMEIVLY
ncbi:MAG: family 43 glycosylhydrolase [Clostridiales bacterium]|nr:family 43 glycosylhydrolase [Clostridiales bacterium]